MVLILFIALDGSLSIILQLFLSLRSESANSTMADSIIYTTLDCIFDNLTDKS